MSLPVATQTLNPIQPVYCETPPVVGQVYPLPFELVNSVSSLIPTIFALLALWYMMKQKVRRYDLYLLVALLFSVGIGSALWHGWRTSLFLTLDVIPGLLFLLCFTLLWPAYLRGRWWAYGTFFALFALQFISFQLIRLMPVDGPPISFFVGLFVLGAVLMYFTWRDAGKTAFWWGTASVMAATAAAVFRSIDGIACAYIPFGSHFLWHVFLGFSAYCGIVLLVKIHQAKPVDKEA